ncbi:MAG: hypothetical protein IMF05_02435 [Proteobacteria bacterium]|nr:hypothetical protein [Pseudomonadota bacterium]
MSKRRRTPQEKKRLRYERDFDPNSEYPHGFRKTWPRKKAKKQRAHRHAVKQDLEALLNGEVLDKVEDRVGGRRKFALRKWGVRSLGERVRNSLQKRRDTIGWNFFSRRYSPPRHREKFIAFLESLMKGDSAETELRKDVVRGWLQPRQGLYHFGHRLRWLDAFFTNAPEWKTKLLDWLKE